MRGDQSFRPCLQNLGGSNNSWRSGAYASSSYKVDIF
jgi:hypothetical protein